MRKVTFATSGRLAWLVAAMFVSLGCPGENPSAPGAVTLVVNPTSASVQQGGSTPVTVTATTGDGFGGVTTFTITGAPAGVTGVASNVATNGASTTATVTIQAAVSTTPGTYNISVRIEAAGLGNGSTTLQLTVTAVPNFGLSLGPASLSIVQGASGTSAVTINRTNFVGAVTLSLGNAPAGVTGAFVPAAPTGTSSTLTVSVGGAVTPGTYNLTVDGAGTPGSRSASLSLTVTASGGGPATVTVSFAGCESYLRAEWLAYRDGAGAWTRVTGTNDVFTFTVTSSTAGVAYAANTSDEPGVAVHFLTKSEMAAGTVRFCDPAPAATGRFWTGTVTNVPAPQYAYLSLGGSTGSALSAGPYNIGSVQNGTHDLVGFRTNPFAPGTVERGLLRRDIVVNANGSYGTADFTGSESFAAASATVTIGGLSGGEVLVHNTFYHVGASCAQSILLTSVVPGTSFTAYGIPAAQQRASDYHRVLIFAHSDATSDPVQTRTVTESFQALAARTMNVGAALPAPTLTTLAGPYLRLQAVYAVPAEYQMSTTFYYGNASVTATAGYLAGANATLAVPDFTGLTGWSNSWMPASGSSGEWSISARGGTSGSVCTANARAVTASRRGTY